MTDLCTWCGAAAREMVTLARNHACTRCWDSDELAGLRGLLDARADLDAALTVCGIDPDTGVLTDPGRDTREAIHCLVQLSDRLRQVVTQARKETRR